jgi:uncharacterized membrane protein YjjP (DUF1212 family)
MAKLSAVYELARAVLADEFQLVEAKDILDGIQTSRYDLTWTGLLLFHQKKTWRRVFSFNIVILPIMSFTVCICLFGGSWQDAGMASVMGLLVACVTLMVEK